MVVLNPKSRLAETVDPNDFHQAALYRRLVRELGSVSWVSYGGRADRALSDGIDGVEILCNRWGLSPAAYQQELPWLHRAAFERATVVKSEQILAGPIATRIARQYGKPLISRSGFSVAGLAANEGWANQAQLAATERTVQRVADYVVVSSQKDRERTLERTGQPPDRVRIIPNFVDLSLFHPAGRPSPRGEQPRLLAVGRLVHQKNFDALITATAPLTGVRVRIIGRGGLESSLRERIEREGLDHIEIRPTMSQERLAEHYREATLVLQPSFFEGGHPKTVIEAMACGAPVIGADITGIDNVISHDQNGWLCGTDPESIRDAVTTLLGDERSRERLGRAGHDYVRDELSLDRAVERELALIDEVESLPQRSSALEARQLSRSLWRTGKWRARSVVSRLAPRDR